MRVRTQLDVSPDRNPTPNEEGAFRWRARFVGGARHSTGPLCHPWVLSPRVLI
jgi:hypothetical protein